MQKEKNADFQKYIERDPSWYYRYYTDWKRWQEEREFSTIPRVDDQTESLPFLVDPDRPTSTPRPYTVEEVETAGSSQWVYVGVTIGVSSIIAFIVSFVTNRMHRPGQVSMVML